MTSFGLGGIGDDREYPVDIPGAIPGVGDTIAGVYLSPTPQGVTITYPGRLRAGPIPRDPKLPIDHPDQQLTDCRDIEGWTDTIKRLCRAAWPELDTLSDGFRFTHDWAIIPTDPSNLNGIIIVYEILAMTPGKRGAYSELKPSLREVLPARATMSTATDGTVRAAPDPVSEGRTWVWGQRLDTCVRFTVYGDTWGRAIEYGWKFFDLMTMYTGIFKQAGLQELFFRGQGQDALHDPPKNVALPNQMFTWNATIERLTVTTYAQVEEIVVTAGIINPLTYTAGTQELEAESSGVPDSPTLPRS